MPKGQSADEIQTVIASNKPDYNGNLVFVSAVFITIMLDIILISYVVGSQRHVTTIGILIAALSINIFFLVTSTFSRRRNPISILISIYLSSFYIFPGIIHLHQEKFPFFNASYSDFVLEKSSVIVLVFTVFYYAGILFHRHNYKQKIQIDIQSADKNTTTAILALMALSLAAGVVVGFDSLNITRGDSSALNVSSSPLKLILDSAARIGGFFAFLYASIKIRAHFSLVSAALLFSSGLVLFLTNNILSMPRFVVASYLITFVLVHFEMTRIRKVAAVAVMLVAQVTLFPILSEVARGDISRFFRTSPIEYLSTHGDFDGFQSTASVVQMVEGTGLMVGRQLLSAALFFVPREFFPDKSVGTGADAAIYASFHFTNLSAPLPSEFYVDFGYPGLVILSFIFGMAVASFDRQYDQRSRGGSLQRMVVPSIIAGYSFILMRGTLVGVVGPFALSMAFALLAENLASIQHVKSNRR